MIPEITQREIRGRKGGGREGGKEEEREEELFVSPPPQLPKEGTEKCLLWAEFVTNRNGSGIILQRQCIPKARRHTKQLT